MDIFTNTIQEFAKHSLPLSIFLTLIFLVPVQMKQIKEITLKRIILIIICIVLLGVLFFTLSNLINIKYELLIQLSEICFSVIFLRIIRIFRNNETIRLKFEKLTLIDILFVTQLFFTYRLIHNSYSWYLSIPFLFYCSCAYTLFNAIYYNRNSFLLARWLMLAYSFPEAGEHQQKRLENRESNLNIVSLVGWTVTIILVTYVILYSFYFSKFTTLTLIVILIQFLSGLTMILLNQLKIGISKSNNWQSLLVGSGIISFTVLLLSLLTSSEVLFSNTNEFRFLRSPIYFTPMIIILFLLKDTFYDKKKYFSGYRSKFWVLESIIKIGNASVKSIFGTGGIATLQSILISIVFIIYALLPHSEQVFKSFEIDSIGGVQIEQIIQYFIAHSSEWSSPDAGNDESSFKFIFGNQGLILLTLAWPVVIYMGFAEYNLRIGKIRNLPLGKSGSIINLLLWIFTAIPLLPLTVLLVLLIPFIGISLIGQSIAIIFGAIALSSIIPKFIGFNSSLVFLTYLSAIVKEENNAVKLNSVSMETLCLLPGIGKNIAKNIILARPITNKESLLEINGINKNKLEKICPLIHCD